MKTHAFQTGMAKLAAAFGVTLGEGQAIVYHEVLGNMDDDTWTIVVRRALMEWTRAGQLPTPGILIGYANEAQRASGAIVDGDSAWDAFRARVLGRYSFGITKVFDWPDELTRDVVRNHLGINSAAVHNLAMIESDIERDKYRKRFITEYNARRNSATAQEATGLLPPTPLHQIGGNE